MPSGPTGAVIAPAPPARITASCSLAPMTRRPATERPSAIDSDSLAPLVSSVSCAQP